MINSLSGRFPWLKSVVLVSILLVQVVLVFNGWKTQNEGLAWEIPIEGYDPRDLLRGHYLTFRYQWIPESSDSFSTLKHPTEATYLCLMGKSEEPNIIAMTITVVSPDQLQCRARLKYNQNWSDFAPTRYYLPEDIAPAINVQLTKSPEKFRAIIRTKSDTSVALEKILFNGKPIEDYTVQDFSY